MYKNKSHAKQTSQYAKDRAREAKEKEAKDKLKKEKVEKRPAVEIKTGSEQPKLRKPKETKSTSYADAVKKDPKLNSYIKQRKGLTKGTP